MRQTLLVALCLLCATFSFAQQSVSGTVNDDQGNPLPGVNVVEKGTNNGASTDFNGNYSITVQDGATLVFSYIGFNTVEEAVNGRDVLL